MEGFPLNDFQLFDFESPIDLFIVFLDLNYQ